MSDRLARSEAWLDADQARQTDLRALVRVAKKARDVDREWRERGDGGCTTELRLALSAALADLEGGATESDSASRGRVFGEGGA